MSNHFCATFTRHHYDPMVTVRGEPGGVFYLECTSEEEEAARIVDQVEHYIAAGRCGYGDIAILLRSVSISGPAFRG